MKNYSEWVDFRYVGLWHRYVLVYECFMRKWYKYNQNIETEPKKKKISKFIHFRKENFFCMKMFEINAVFYCFA